LPPASIGSVGGNYSIIGAGPSHSLAYSAAWACVQVLTQDLAKLGVDVWEGSDEEGWQLARLNPLYALLRRPNAWMSRFELIRYQVMSLLMDGNSYNLIVRDREYEPVNLIPINPRYVSVYQADNGELFYGVSSRYGALETTLPEEPGIRIPQRDILHIRHLSMDGVIGLSPLSAARLAIEYGQNLERQGASLSGRGGKPGGVIKMPNRLSPEQARRLREEWDTIYNGEGQGRTAILEEGITFEPLAFRSIDIQFLELRRFQAEEVARIFRIMPFMIGIMEKLSYNNVEHLMKLYTDSTLMPYAELFEGAYSLAFGLGDRTVIEFDFSRLLRGDTAARFSKYSTGIQWGVLSPNDARREEGLNPYADGDTYLRPLNMGPADAPAEERPVDEEETDA
jgi:HK97 family phage portal protein